MKSLSSGQQFPKSMRRSRAGNSHANTQKWAKIDFSRDFMPVLVICKFDEDPIKNEVAIIRTTFSLLYVYDRLKDKYLSLEKSDLPKNQAHPRFYSCPNCLI